MILAWIDSPAYGRPGCPCRAVIFSEVPHEVRLLHLRVYAAGLRAGVGVDVFGLCVNGINGKCKL
jgi:hypothetical protein